MEAPYELNDNDFYVDEYDPSAEAEEFYTRVVGVECKVCHYTLKASRHILESLGWVLTPIGDWCSQCVPAKKCRLCYRPSDEATQEHTECMRYQNALADQF